MIITIGGIAIGMFLYVAFGIVITLIFDRMFEGD